MSVDIEPDAPSIEGVCVFGRDTPFALSLLGELNQSSDELVELAVRTVRSRTASGARSSTSSNRLADSIAGSSGDVTLRAKESPAEERNDSDHAVLRNEVGERLAIVDDVAPENFTAADVCVLQGALPTACVCLVFEAGGNVRAGATVVAARREHESRRIRHQYGVRATVPERIESSRHRR